MVSWRDEVLHVVEGLELEFLDSTIKFLIISPNHVNFADLAYSLMLNETAVLKGKKMKTNTSFLREKFSAKNIK